MKLRHTLIFFVAALVSHACLAQEAIKEDFKPSTLNQPGQEYPQVNSQGYARFQIKAPTAGLCPGKPWAWRKRWNPACQNRQWLFCWNN